MTTLQILEKLKDLKIINTQTVIKLRSNLATNKISAEIVVKLFFQVFEKVNSLEEKFNSLQIENKKLKNDIKKLKNED